MAMQVGGTYFDLRTGKIETVTALMVETAARNLAGLDIWVPPPVDAYRIMFPDGTKYWVKGENFPAAVSLGASEISQQEMDVGRTTPYPYWTPPTITDGLSIGWTGQPGEQPTASSPLPGWAITAQTAYAQTGTLPWLEPPPEEITPAEPIPVIPIAASGLGLLALIALVLYIMSRKT